jgi:catalase-peroxidase
VQAAFNGSAADGKRVSLADLIVLGGCAAVEEAAMRAGYAVRVPFTPGRTDATADATDVASFAVLEPRADAFRNYVSPGLEQAAAEFMVDKAQLLDLSPPEMTVLIGGMRALDANFGHHRHGVLTERPGQLTNDFFINLLDMGLVWTRTTQPGVFEGRDRKTGTRKWTATSVDLVLGSHSELRALAEVYAADDAGESFAHDFAAAFGKVMELDRFDLRRPD